MTRKMVSKMTYNVSSGMLNLLYHTILIVNLAEGLIYMSAFSFTIHYLTVSIGVRRATWAKQPKPR